MSRTKNFRDLLVWQKSMNLVENTYQVTRGFPKEETYGLISQMRRCAISIPSNISEGHGRISENEFKHFLGIASGSLSELETQIELSIRLGYVEQTTSLPENCMEVAKMLKGLIKALNR